jgi:hypothetical protein
MLNICWLLRCQQQAGFTIKRYVIRQVVGVANVHCWTATQVYSAYIRTRYMIDHPVGGPNVPAEYLHLISLQVLCVARNDLRPAATSQVMYMTTTSKHEQRYMVICFIHDGQKGQAQQPATATEPC